MSGASATAVSGAAGSSFGAAAGLIIDQGVDHHPMRDAVPTNQPRTVEGKIGISIPTVDNTRTVVPRPTSTVKQK